MTASLPNPVTPTVTAALRVAGAVVAYRLHDVGYALDLERAARLVERQATGRLRPTRGEAKALVIAQPPLTLALGPALRPDDGGPLGELSACCYDFGVISLRLRVAVREEARWADLLSVMRSLERTDLTAVFGPALSALTHQLQPAIVRPAVAPVVEDYTICRLTRLCDGTGASVPPSGLDDRALVELLLGEPRVLRRRPPEPALAPLQLHRAGSGRAELGRGAGGRAGGRRSGRRVSARVRQRAAARASGVRRLSRRGAPAALRPRLPRPPRAGARCWSAGSRTCSRASTRWWPTRPRWSSGWRTASR